MTVLNTSRRQRPVRQAGPRGWWGPGGGESTVIQAPGEFRGTNVQVCGLWPFVIGSGVPEVGVPLGRHLFSGGTVCCDPISWFQDAQFITNPSAYVLGLAGYGKSSLIKHMVLGSSAFGRIPMIFGDVKPDYPPLIRALNGEVLELGRGVGYLNILDPGDVRSAAGRLSAGAAAKILGEAHARRLTMLQLLIRLNRMTVPTELEDSLLDAALHLVYERITARAPVIADVLDAIETGPEVLRAVARDRGEPGRYADNTEGLIISLRGLLGSGRLGELFSRQSSAHVRRDVPMVFDLSRIAETDTELRAAALAACWSTGFFTIEIAGTLADAGVEPRRHYDVVLDEEKLVLEAGQGMVKKINALVRTNRTKGAGIVHCTHTISDLDSLTDPEERENATAFIKHAGILIVGALPQEEACKVSALTPLSGAEMNLITSWVGTSTVTGSGGKSPQGRGKFMIKVGRNPGIPFRVQLTEQELALTDTNQRWHEYSSVSAANRELEEPGP